MREGQGRREGGKEGSCGARVAVRTLNAYVRCAHKYFFYYSCSVQTRSSSRVIANTVVGAVYGLQCV